MGVLTAGPEIRVVNLGKPVNYPPARADADRFVADVEDEPLPEDRMYV